MISISLYETPTGRSPISLTFILIIAILNISVSVQQMKFQYSSKQIKCDIYFDQTAREQPSLQKQLIFKNCTLTECTSFKFTGECKIEQKFRLEEQKCYKQCCDSSQFDDETCQTYAAERDKLKAVSDQTIIIILSSSLGGILVSTVIFVICYLKCFKNYEKQAQKQMNGDSGSDKNFCYYWRPYKFKNDKKCGKCETLQAFIMLSCDHFFHLECLKRTIQWQCPKCKKNITKVRVFCTTCCNYYTTIKADSPQALEQQIALSYQLHPEKCSEKMVSELNSDRKFTISTKD